MDSTSLLIVLAGHIGQAFIICSAARFHQVANIFLSTFVEMFVMLPGVLIVTVVACPFMVLRWFMKTIAYGERVNINCQF